MSLSAMVVSGRDLHAQVFVWVGRDSDTTKHKAAQKKGQQLGQRDGRAANTPVSIVQPGKEPSLFTAGLPVMERQTGSSGKGPMHAFDSIPRPSPLDSQQPLALAINFSGFCLDLSLTPMLSQSALARMRMVIVAADYIVPNHPVCV